MSMTKGIGFVQSCSALPDSPPPIGIAHADWTCQGLNSYAICDTRGRLCCKMFRKVYISTRHGGRFGSFRRVGRRIPRFVTKMQSLLQTGTQLALSPNVTKRDWVSPSPPPCSYHFHKETDYEMVSRASRCLCVGPCRPECRNGSAPSAPRPRRCPSRSRSWSASCATSSRASRSGGASSSCASRSGGTTSSPSPSSGSAASSPSSSRAVSAAASSSQTACRGGTASRGRRSVLPV